MTAADPVADMIAVCTYRVCSGEAAAFERLLEAHVPTLRGLGLITDFPAQALRRAGGGGGGGGDPIYVEVFQWASADAATRAAEVPEVIAIWEPMAALCESREGRPGLEFPLFDRIRSR